MDTRETRNDKDAVEALEAAQLTVAAGQRELFAAIARCDHDQVWRANGCRELAQWLSGRLGISNWAARRWVVAAHALERLPRLADAFQFGVLSVDKVCDLARFATPETEARLTRWARRVSPATVRRRADLAFRPDLQAVREADKARYLRTWWYEDGSGYGLEGYLPPEQGAVIERALKRLAERVPEPLEGSTHPDGSPLSYETRMEMRRADALFLLASAEVVADPDPDRACVVVHADFAALAQGPEGASSRAGR